MKQARWAFALVFALLLAFITAGLAASTASLVRDLGREPAGIFAITGLALVLALVAGCRYSIRSVQSMSETRYVSALAAAWVVTRGTIVFACLRWPLVVDEIFLHRFIGQLRSGGFSNRNFAQLSELYDYPVWLSRAFPVYYPLRVLFGDGDIAAVRFANVLMGAATVCFVYALAKEIVGGRYARCAAFLYFISPFQFLDAVSYTPQIPGTLAVTIALWLIVRGMKVDSVRPWQIVSSGVAIGLLLFIVRIQRGGFDQLILAGYPVLIALYAVARERPFRTLMPAGAIAAVAFLVWAPSAHAFDSWVQSHDTHHLRSHMLGFMVRGSNPVTLGEYLLRYELLDTVSLPEEKDRVMLSVLATESAREPLITLGVLPAVKAAKLFSIGHAAPALVSSLEAGYLSVSLVFRAAIDVYAPLFLILCALGILHAAVYPRLGGRLVLMCWFTISAGLAIVIAGETSAVYSHGFQPALAVLAAAGTAAFRDRPRYTATRMVRAAAPQLAAAGAVVIVAWIVAAAGVCLFAMLAGNLLFRDMRGTEARISGLPVPAEPLNRWTQSWEKQIVLPENTALPAKLHLRWPGSAPASSVQMRIWTDGEKVACGCRVVVPDKGRVAGYSNLELAKMFRGNWSVTDSAGGDVIDVDIVPDGSGKVALPQPLALDVGYAY